MNQITLESLHEITKTRQHKGLTRAERFWAFVDKKLPDECWEWKGYISARGYGKFQLKGVQNYAHRVAYTLTHGEIPQGMFILHSCDNPPCCNPSHLRVGTLSENQREMRAKGRYPSKLTAGGKNKMFTYTQVYNQYKIAINNPGSGQRGFSVLCKDIEEVHIAIDHYELRQHDKSKCPLCKRTTKGEKTK